MKRRFPTFLARKECGRNAKVNFIVNEYIRKYFDKFTVKIFLILIFTHREISEKTLFKLALLLTTKIF